MDKEIKNRLILVTIKSVFWVAGAYLFFIGLTMLLHDIGDTFLALFIMYLGIGIIIMGKNIKED